MSTQTTLVEQTTQAQVDDFLLELLPLQGHWSEEQYLWVTDFSNRLIEYTDGYIEVLPMPTDQHQSVLAFLFQLFRDYLRPLNGKVLFSPLRLRIESRRFREPDLLLVRSADDPRRQNRFWLGADLVLEVVSPDKVERDLVQKRGDYADGGVPEYWIVNPLNQTITVLVLQDKAYTEHGVFLRGELASSATLEGFTVAVSEVFDTD
ncbi:MAG: Uma2 family endonuclease [Roseiflexaceae bacterium]|nr:Uma2 family endonuclease [Roseiflexaceae bacterium]